jgi:ribosomal protein S18 acetylase RimI-like enzyme
MNETPVYDVNRASGPEIVSHLLLCDVDFVSTLRGRVDLDDYALKIVTKAVRFEAWSAGQLVGLVAAYCNDNVNHIAYITSVSVWKQWAGRGIGAGLVGQCLEYAKSVGMKRITLEVARNNAFAFQFYTRHGFVVGDVQADFVKMYLPLKNGEENDQDA